MKTSSSTGSNEQATEAREPRFRSHEHVFGQDRPRPGELRTKIVIALTATTMIVEVTAGVAFGSMALLADGLHMASHAAALTIAAIAYVYARRHAADTRYSFGTGKVNALAGFTGALLLALFAGGMTVESIERLLVPVDIVFNQALAVAVVGLIVNVASVFILGSAHQHDHHHDEDHHHDDGHRHHEEHHHREDVDHNLRSAHLHVLADALTSVAAIGALLTGKYVGLVWMDPVMGIVGALLVGRWSWGLIRDSSAVLLDRQAPGDVVDRIRQSIEPRANVLDLHVWSIGPGMRACILSVSDTLGSSPDSYAKLLPGDLDLVHVTVEIWPAGRED